MDILTVITVVACTLIGFAGGMVFGNRSWKARHVDGTAFISTKNQTLKVIMAVDAKDAIAQNYILLQTIADHGEMKDTDNI